MGETNTQKVIRVLMTPAAELELTMRQVLTLRRVDNAVGVQLDVLGGYVGRAREGIADDDIYRRYVRAQIKTNRSSGTLDELLTIAKLVIGDPNATFVLDNSGAAAFTLRVESVTVSDAVSGVLANTIGRATDAAVRPLIGYTTGPVGLQMRWGTGTWGQNWSRARLAR